MFHTHSLFQSLSLFPFFFISLFIYILMYFKSKISPFLCSTLFFFFFFFSTAQQLDSDQYSAATSFPDEPLILFACAGSGKTKTMLWRIGYLLSCNVPPDRLLAMTVSLSFFFSAGGDWVLFFFVCLSSSPPVSLHHGRFLYCFAWLNISSMM